MSFREVSVSIWVKGGQREVAPRIRKFRRWWILYSSRMTGCIVFCPEPVSKYSSIFLLLLILLAEVSADNHMDLGHADRVLFYARDVGISAKDVHW